jgi:hypothetical protein
MIVGGPVTSLYGRRFFPWVIAGIVAVTLLLSTLVVCDVLGFTQTMTAFAISITIATMISGLAGWFVMKTVWIAVGILGLIGGFFTGSMVYTIFLAAFSSGHLWIMMTFSCLSALVGGFLSFKFSKQVVLVSTSLIGSYAFMKGLTYFFGGFPGEATIYQSLKQQTPIEGLTNAFWIYLALFVSGCVAGMIY